ncbi:MAG: hypothetical protein WC453_01775 [Patescibacteria group bacterium]
MDNNKLFWRGALDALGTVAYVALVSLVMNNAERFFGTTKTVVGPIAFLLLFVFSALVTGGLILGKPLMMYLDGQKKESVKLLLYTGANLLVLLILAFAVLILKR